MNQERKSFLLQTFIKKNSFKHEILKNHRDNKWLFAIYYLLAQECIKFEILKIDSSVMEDI